MPKFEIYVSRTTVEHGRFTIEAANEAEANDLFTGMTDEEIEGEVGDVWEDSGFSSSNIELKDLRPKGT